MSMTDEQKVVLILKGLLSEASPETQAKVAIIMNRIQGFKEEFGEEATALAICLIGCAMGNR